MNPLNRPVTNGEELTCAVRSNSGLTTEMPKPVRPNQEGRENGMSWWQGKATYRFDITGILLTNVTSIGRKGENRAKARVAPTPPVTMMRGDHPTGNLMPHGGRRTTGEEEEALLTVRPIPPEGAVQKDVDPLTPTIVGENRGTAPNPLATPVKNTTSNSRILMAEHAWKRIWPGSR